jgi:hypothetical protein
MTRRLASGSAALLLLILGSDARSQSTPISASASADQHRSSGGQVDNVQEYVKLLRADIHAEKSKILGSAMQLDAAQAEKFWPIYRDYDARLTKLNDMRVSNILEYARTYSDMSDIKADELANGAIVYHKRRIELLATCYDNLRDALGSVVAARFMQVEGQLLSIIDLQIASELPLMWQD